MIDRKEYVVLVLTIVIAFPIELLMLNLNWAIGAHPDWLALFR